ncbi:MAG: NADH-quinone oxidoreductase subunit M [Bacteroidota bacterium]
MITLLILLFPLAAGLLMLLLRGEVPRYAALAFTLIELVFAGHAAYYFDLSPENAGGVQMAFSIPWIKSAGLSFSVGMDGISLILVLLSTILLPIIVLSTFDNKTLQAWNTAPAFYGLMLIMQSGLIGVFVAQDAFLFYFFWEMALIPIYFISGIWGGERRIKVTFKFFIYTIFGSLFMLVGLVALWYQTRYLPGGYSGSLESIYAVGRNLSGNVQCWLFWMLFIAFAIKMPVFPFHTWQPDTYTEAPAAGTMLLSGIMLKMGIYGVIRWLLPVVPEGVHCWGPTVMTLSVIGIIYGSVIALRQKDIKRLVAYSSFAHVGLMAAGVFSLTFSGMHGAVIQMLSHGVCVVGLFAVIEFVQRRTHSRDIDRLGGITQSSASLTVYFMILMLGSVALPLTSGFVGEFLLLKGVYEWGMNQGWLWFGAVAGLTIILGAVYMLRLFQGVMFGQKSELTVKFDGLTSAETFTLIPLCALVLWIGVAPDSFLDLCGPAVDKLLKQAALVR